MTASEKRQKQNTNASLTAAEADPINGSIGRDSTVGTVSPLMVLDASVITRLARDLESFPDALAFVERYTALLDDRIEATHTELTSPATSDRLTALLSLHASSVMAGAAQLQHTTERAIATLRTRTLTAQQVTTLHQRLILQARDFTEAHNRFRAGSLLVINPARHVPDTSTTSLGDRDDDHR